jgi:regulator of replication initiation timing
VGDDIEDVRRRIAELSVEIEVLKAKVMKCLEVVARLREELEGLKRRVRKPSRECIEALRAYEVMEADEPGPP